MSITNKQSPASFRGFQDLAPCNQWPTEDPEALPSPPATPAPAERAAADRLTAQLVDRFPSLVAAAFPEAAGRPCYLVLESMLPVSLKPQAWGYQWDSCDWAARPYVDWQGPGVAVVLCDRFIRQSMPSHLVRCALASVTLHELAHVRALDFEEYDELAPAGLLPELISKELPEMETVGWPPWHTHDWRFLRNACHLLHRSQLAGQPWDDATDYYVVAGPSYALSPLWAYVEALGDEPAKLAGLTWAELQATAPPARFRHQWLADVHRWAAKADPDIAAAALADSRNLFT